MGFALTLLYVGLTILSPAELFPELAPYRIMLWLAILAILASLPSLLRPDWLRLPHSYLMLGFIVAICLSRVLNGWLSGVPSALAIFLPVAIIFFLIVCNVNTLFRFRVLTAMLILLALYLLIFGAIAYYTGDENSLYVIGQPVWIDESLGLRRSYLRIRALGFYNDPNDFAQYMLMLLPLLLTIWQRGRSVRNFFVCLLPAALLLYGIYLTNSRGALVGLAVLLMLLLYRRFGGARTLALVPFAVVAILVLNRGGREISVHEDSAMGRVDAWSDGLGMFEHSPLWGVGFGEFTDHHEITAHNSYVLCMSELGLTGCFAWMGLMAASMLQLQKLCSAPIQDEDISRWSFALLSSLWTVLITSWFLSRTYAPTLYISVGMAAALSALYINTQSQSLPRTHWIRAVLVAMPLVIAAVYATVRMRSI